MQKIIYKIVYLLSPKKYKLHLRKMRLGYNLVTSEHSYLLQTGYVNSKINNSLTNNDNENIPWMNYPFIELLNEKLKKDLASSSVLLENFKLNLISVPFKPLENFL